MAGMKDQPEKHQITHQMRQNIVHHFRLKGLTQLQLGNLIGKSEAWVSKMLSGKQVMLDDGTFRKLEIALEMDFFGVERSGKTSPIAAQIAAMVDSDPIFARLAECARDAVIGARVSFTPRYVPTEEMADLGQKIIAIAVANQEKPGKVAKLILQLLA